MERPQPGAPGRIGTGTVTVAWLYKAGGSGYVGDPTYGSEIDLVNLGPLPAP